MITPLQIEACRAALKDMHKRGHFSLCVVDQILAITGGVPNAEDYKTLRLLHCVDFKDMSPALRIEFPALLKRVIESGAMEFTIEFKPGRQVAHLLN